MFKEVCCTYSYTTNGHKKILPMLEISLLWDYNVGLQWDYSELTIKVKNAIRINNIRVLTL